LIGEKAVVKALRRSGLTRPAFRALERYRAAKMRNVPDQGSDGLPLPPPLLMVQVAGHADHEKFLSGGRQASQTIAEAVDRQGVAMADMGAIFDFGIGCGRVARHWQHLDGPRIVGSDYNRRLVAWCNENLPFLSAHQNQLEPPLSQADEQFDLVYAISVFTHLTESMQRAWLAELRRVTKPGGLLLLSTAGMAFRPVLERFDHDLLKRFDRGEMVVADQAVAGTNRCLAYHPEGWLERHLLDGFTLAEFVPSGVPSSGNQDLYVLQKLAPPTP
jgi:SAM-dependent methyltransferase